MEHHLYNRPTWWTPILLWMLAGDKPRNFMCPDCENEDGCDGCPVAYRTIDGKPEYWRKPIHGYQWECNLFLQ